MIELISRNWQFLVTIFTIGAFWANIDQRFRRLDEKMKESKERLDKYEEKSESCPVHDLVKEVNFIKGKLNGALK